MGLFKDRAEPVRIAAGCPNCGGLVCANTGNAVTPLQAKSGTLSWVEVRPSGLTFVCLKCWTPFVVTDYEVFIAASGKPQPKPVVNVVKPREGFAGESRPVGLEDANLGRFD